VIAQTFPFLSLPAELRNAVYEYAADYNDIIPAFNRLLAKFIPNVASPPGFIGPHKSIVRDELARFQHELSRREPLRSTPTIFLLNRQITAEAIYAIYRRPLIINSPKILHSLRLTEWRQCLARLMISASSVRRIPRVCITVDSEGGQLLGAIYALDMLQQQRGLDVRVEIEAVFVNWLDYWVRAEGLGKLVEVEKQEGGRCTARITG